MNYEIIETLLYILLGVGLFFISLSWLNRFFNNKMKYEIVKDHNMSFAVVIASFVIGIAIIIASAIVG